MIRALPRSSGADWLERLGRLLLCALPVLFLIGRAPADIALSLIGLLLLMRSGLCREWSWLRTPWVAVGLALWLYLIAASALANDVEAAYSRALPFGRFVLFGAALQHWLLVEPATRRTLLLVLGGVVAFVCFDTLLQFATGRDLFGYGYEAKRLTGPFGDKVPGTFLAKTSFPALGLALALTAAWQRRWRFALMVGLIMLLAVTVAVTGERIALLSLGLGLLVFVLLLRDLRLPLLLAGCAAFLLVAGTVASSPDLRARLIGHTAYDLEDFWGKRYGELFLRSLRIWQDDPLIGIGLKNFRLECANDHFLARGPVEDRCYTHPHHIYLEWLVESGALGFAGFLVLLALWARDIISGLRRIDPADYPIAVGALAALIVFLWPLRASMSFFSNWNATLFWLMLGLALALTASQGRRPVPDRHQAVTPPS
jgi:O-antigen ligase